MHKISKSHKFFFCKKGHFCIITGHFSTNNKSFIKKKKKNYLIKNTERGKGVTVIEKN